MSKKHKKVSNYIDHRLMATSTITDAFPIPLLPLCVCVGGVGGWGVTGYALGRKSLRFIKMGGEIFMS